MDVRASVEVRCGPAVLFDRVSSLDTYDEWLDIVPRTSSAEEMEGDAGPAWHVTLRGKLGPLARSKRLRMVRTVHEPVARAVFERQETDGREHAVWRLTADVSPMDTGARLDMRLEYEGSLWIPLLDRLLAAEIEASRGRLRKLVEPDTG